MRTHKKKLRKKRTWKVDTKEYQQFLYSQIPNWVQEEVKKNRLLNAY